MKILVVDDSKTMRLILGRTLKELGHEVHEAGDGKAALETLQKDPAYELVLSDWNMPEMNGLDLVKSMRSIAELKKVPIMMVTTETEAGNIQKALEAGANEYIMKPFNKETVAEKLQVLKDQLGIKTPEPTPAPVVAAPIPAPVVAAPTPAPAVTPAAAPAEIIPSVIPDGALYEIVERVFSSMVGLSVEQAPQPWPELDLMQGKPHLTAVVGISEANSKFRYVVALHMQAKLACKVGEKLLAEPCTEMTIPVQDALGELVNMISGNLKSLIDRPGTQLSMPTVISGREYYWSLPRMRILQHVVILSEGELMHVWFGDDFLKPTAMHHA